MVEEEPKNANVDAEAQPAGLMEDATAGLTSLVEGAAAEIRDQVYSEEHPLGPFKAPESVETTGIRENVGYVPRWLVYLFIMAVILSLFAWMKMGQPG